MIASSVRAPVVGGYTERAVLFALNTSLRRGRGRIRLLLVTLALGVSVLAAHGALAGGHMAWPAAGDMTMTGGHVMGGSAKGSVDELMAMCLAIAETAAVGLGAMAVAVALAALLGLTASVRWPDWPLVMAPRAALAPRARPPDLSRLQVFRR